MNCAIIVIEMCAHALQRSLCYVFSYDFEAYESVHACFNRQITKIMQIVMRLIYTEL